MNLDIEQKSIKPKKFYHLLYIQVQIAIVFGVSLGYFYPDLGEKMKPLGDGFIKLVKMIIAPVIFLTVSTGIAGMSDLKKVGRVAGKAFAYFFTFSTLALIIGLVVSNLVQPGKGLNIDPSTLNSAEVEKYVKAAHDNSMVSFIYNIIPETLFSPLTGDNILQVLLVAILFGVNFREKLSSFRFSSGFDNSDFQGCGNFDETSSNWRFRSNGFHYWEIWC